MGSKEVGGDIDEIILGRGLKIFMQVMSISGFIILYSIFIYA